MNTPAPTSARIDAVEDDGDAPQLSAEAFLLRLGRALHRRGVPAHRLEEHLEALCRRLGLTASFFSTPTALFAQFDRGSRPDVYLLRVTGASSDLGKLTDLDQVSMQVSHGEITHDEGMARIDRIEAAPPRYGPAITTACYAINSAAASVFFNGGWREVATAGVLGLISGLLSLVGSRSGTGWRAFEPVAAFCAAVVSTLAALRFGPVSVHVAVLAGLIALLPGYTLVVAIAELANGHLASGSARITAAFMVFLTLGFGVALGNRCTELFFGVAPTVEPVALPLWVQALALGCASATFGVVFRARREDLPYILIVSVLGFCGARVGSAFLGPELGVFLGALVVTLCSNLYARVLNRPTVVPLFPGIMLLVPGSIGFRSLSSLMAHDVVSGVQTAFTMVLVAVALVAGLLLANAILPAKRAL
ncbi:MAG: threonine/serine exporter family protein [Myxococcaceae bacterium]|nr:threonine/serine exporter family protein [Myxococcaceae bacterium]